MTRAPDSNPMHAIGYGRGDDTAEALRMPTPKQTVAQHFKAIAQERKRDKLVAHFDLTAETIGLKPHTEDAADIAEALAGWGDSTWSDAAKEAGVNPPSGEVREMVIGIYRERSRQ